MCDDGKKADDCMTPGDVKVADEDAAAEALKASGVKDAVVYASDAVRVNFYGCSRIGDSNDAVCVFDLAGSGYDWLLQFPCRVQNSVALNSTANDDMGREYRATAATIAGDSSCDRTLVESIETEARVRFDDIHSGATAFSLLSVAIDAYSTQENPAPEMLMFRDVSLD